MSTQLDAVSAIQDPTFAKLSAVLLESCAYAGSGNVIQVQKLLHLCAEHLNEDGMNQQEVEEKKREEEVCGSKCSLVLYQGSVFIGG